MTAVRAHPTMLLGAAAALGIAGAIGVALAPTLLTYSPLLLIALSPVPRHLVMAATVTTLLPFVVVGTARSMLSSILGYYIGRAYGGPGIAWVKTRYPRIAPALGVLESLFQRAGVLCVFVAPWPVLCALAGATGMKAWLFLPVTIASQATWMIISYQVGEALSDWIAPITNFIRENMLSTTLACIALVVVYRWYRRRRGARAVDVIAQVDAAAPASEVSPGVPESKR